MEKDSLYRSAVAILSDDSFGQDAPIISAAGDFYLADTIVALAKKHSIPIIEKPALTRSLRLIEIGEEIPAYLYRAVAIVLCEIEKFIGRDAV